MEKYVGVTADLYERLIGSNQHILIAGMTGSGKSVLMNGMINSILYKDNAKHTMALCDVKMVEFNRYANTKHCWVCAVTPTEVERTLETTLKIINKRLIEMKVRKIKTYDGTILHLFVDELADLMSTSKQTTNLLQRICQIGRAAGIQVICATQCPLTQIIPTRIKVNFPITIGLHTATAQHSRNILEVNGCEKLPMYGEALIKFPTTGIEHVEVPMIPESELDRIVELDEE